MVKIVPYHIGEAHEKEVKRKITVCTVSYINKKGEEATKDVPATKDGKPYSETYQKVKRRNKTKQDALTEHKLKIKAATPESKKKRREDMALLNLARDIDPDMKTQHIVSSSKSGKVFKDEYSKNKVRNIVRAKHGMPLLPTEAPKSA